MHSNERGRVCPRTLVDRQWKRYDNAVDVVVRLHSPTDEAPKLRYLRVLAHVQLDDVPRTLDPAKCRGRVLSAQRRGNGDNNATDARLRLSTTMV